MSIAESFAAELQQEAISTRKALERLPDDRRNWKPREKSSVYLKLNDSEVPGMYGPSANESRLRDFAQDPFASSAWATACSRSEGRKGLERTL
jgi:hypothetical protein